MRTAVEASRWRNPPLEQFFPSFLIITAKLSIYLVCVEKRFSFDNIVTRGTPCAHDNDIQLSSVFQQVVIA